MCYGGGSWPDFVATLLIFVTAWARRVTFSMLPMLQQYTHYRNCTPNTFSSQHIICSGQIKLQELTTYIFVHSYAIPCIVNEMDSSSSEKEWSLYLTDCRAS